MRPGVSAHDTFIVENRRGTNNDASAPYPWRVKATVPADGRKIRGLPPESWTPQGLNENREGASMGQRSYSLAFEDEAVRQVIHGGDPQWLNLAIEFELSDTAGLRRSLELAHL